MGCWGPANHHFQSISVVARQKVEADVGQMRGFRDFTEIETETMMHLAHRFAPPHCDLDLMDLFYDATGLPRDWEVPPTAGSGDPYLKPRGGTKMKKSNKRLR